MSNRNEYYADLERRLLGLLHELRGVLTPHESREVEDFTGHGEYGEALLALAGIIVEEEKEISAINLVEIERLASVMEYHEELPPDMTRHVGHGDGGVTVIADLTFDPPDVEREQFRLPSGTPSILIGFVTGSEARRFGTVIETSDAAPLTPRTRHDGATLVFWEQGAAAMAVPGAAFGLWFEATAVGRGIVTAVAGTGDHGVR